MFIGITIVIIEVVLVLLHKNVLLLKMILEKVGCVDRKLCPTVIKLFVEIYSIASRKNYSSRFEALAVFQLLVGIKDK